MTNTHTEKDILRINIFMQNKKTPPPNRAWLYVAVMIALFVVLVFVLVKRGAPSTSPNPATESSLTEKGLGEDRPGQNGTISPNTLATPNEKQGLKPTSEMLNEATQDAKNNSTGSNNTSQTTSGGSYARLGCYVDTGKVCTIKKNDSMYSVLGHDPDTELIVNGMKIKPEHIIYQTSSDTYTDEQMKDGQEKVLTSTNKEYNEDTKTLTLSIGASPSYYNNLPPTEQRLLYLSQTVRSFMAMFGETPENFVKVERVVDELGSWQPTP